MTMRNDASRTRIDTKEKRRSRAVVARQGQVLLDTDVDQQARHQLERIEIETTDSLGSPGRLLVPAGNTGFKVTPAGAPANFDIGAGRGYLDGWLLENPAVCKLTTQPHPRTGDTLLPPAVIALKALVRFIDPVEEPALADVALGDAQASGRALLDWQVFPLPLALPGGGTGGPGGPGNTITCATVASNPTWQSLVAPSTGTLTVIEQAAAPSTDPCSLTPGGGYTRLENLLYRIEVHGGEVDQAFPTADGPRFRLHDLKLKLSRRNASVMVRIAGIAGAEITVAPPALDPRNWFAPGLYAEIVSLHDDVDPRAALANERLFRVALASDDRVVLEATPAQVAATGATADETWFLRLWDAFPGGAGAGVAVVSAPGNAAESSEIDLGDGLKIKLGAGTFRRGDYWTCAARADGSIYWPKVGGVRQPMRPHGPEVRYAPLAAVSGSSTSPTFDDCRVPFATLSDRALLYRGGDGQGVFAPQGGGMMPLPATLRVAVMRGETPVPGATVRWSFVGPAGGSCLVNGVLCNAASSPETLTDANGLAEVTWSIDGSRPLDVHQVQAALALGATATSRPPVVFSAVFETAAHTAYTPGKCRHLLGVDNVQDALDVLCSKLGERPDVLTLRSITFFDRKHNRLELLQEDLILNGLEVLYTSFVEGIAFGLDGGRPHINIAKHDPVVEVELDLPYPTTDPDRWYWIQAAAPKQGARGAFEGPFGFQRLRLDGTVELRDEDPKEGRGGLIWKPSEQAVRFIESARQHRWGQSVTDEFANRLKEFGWGPKPVFDRILCRIRLRSALIWVDGKEGRVYLNAEHLGVAGPITGRELLARERDPQRAGDLEMFIYLVPEGVKPVVRPDRRPT